MGFFPARAHMHKKAVFIPKRKIKCIFGLQWKQLFFKNILNKKILLNILTNSNDMKCSFWQISYSWVLTLLGKSRHHLRQNFSTELCKSRECENFYAGSLAVWMGEAWLINMDLCIYAWISVSEGTNDFVLDRLYTQNYLSCDKRKWNIKSNRQ